MRRIYLDELPEPPPGNVGLGILRLLASTRKQTVGNARRLIPEVRASAMPAERREMLIQLVETVVAYRFPTSSREEVEKMLQVSDLRHTKVFQEALNEGLEKGREEGLQQSRELIETVVRRLFEEKYSLKKIAELTGLSVAAVKRMKGKD